MKTKYVSMFLGYPGSGKTHFAKRLAEKNGITRLNADATRVAAMGTIERAREFNQATGILNSIVFGMIDYATVQIVEAGNSVICDYQHNTRDFRAKRGLLVAQYGATPVVIWLKVPRDVAVRRGADRKELLDQRRHSIEKMEALVERHSSLIEAPSNDELVIEIDGTAPFEQQYQSFSQQLQGL